MLGAADDGVHRAGLDAFGAADAVGFDDPGTCGGVWLPRLRSYGRAGRCSTCANARAPASPPGGQ
ncbi:hypothetical protein DK27_08575 [Xanthomonas arboricola pv. pruni]|nr:hypothetical protein DK27_08575 [Xanthomonas arboricola pv. pruni]